MSEVCASAYSRAEDLLPELHRQFCQLYRMRLEARLPGTKFVLPKAWRDPKNSYSWHRAAKFVLLQEEPWTEFLGWLFSASRCRRRMPEMTALYSEKIWAQFRAEFNSPEKQRAVDRRLELALQHEKGQLRLAATRAILAAKASRKMHDRSRASLQRHALHSHYEMSALFRYCVAAQEGLKDVADFWRGQAQAQYLPYSSAYDRTWGDLLPANEFRLKGEA